MPPPTTRPQEANKIEKTSRRFIYICMYMHSLSADKHQSFKILAEQFKKLFPVGMCGMWNRYTSLADAQFNCPNKYATKSKQPRNCPAVSRLLIGSTLQHPHPKTIMRTHTNMYDIYVYLILFIYLSFRQPRAEKFVALLALLLANLLAANSRIIPNNLITFKCVLSGLGYLPKSVWAGRKGQTA